MLLVIGGHPRSGTTMLRTLLNRHPAIYVTSELPLRGVYPGMMDLLQTADETHQRIGKYARLESRKERLLTEMWFGLSKFDEKRPRFESATVIGNKTPGSEHFFAKYEERIGYLKPRYLYCLRDPAKVLASVLTMPWSDGKFEPALGRLRDGYEAFTSVRDALGSRLAIFRVDDFAKRPIEISHSLCDFLQVSNETAKKMAEAPPVNTQSRYKDMGKASNRELSDSEVEAIRNDPVIAELWPGDPSSEPHSNSIITASA